MIAGFFAALVAATALGVFLTERIDRPRRRAERLSRAAAARNA